MTALPEEISPLRARARRAGASSAWLDVRLALTGDGAAAGPALGAILAGGPTALVVGGGIAGSLSDDLAPGDVVVGESVRDGDGLAPAPDPVWVARAEAQGARRAALVSVPRPVTSRGQRSALRAPLGDGATAAVDMESAGWARAAGGKGVPYVVLRVISDDAREELPPFLADCLDAKGHLSRARVVGRALVHPGTLPALWRLRRRLAEGSRRLADVLEMLLDEGS